MVDITERGWGVKESRKGLACRVCGSRDCYSDQKKKSLEIKLCIHGAELRILRWHHIESFLLCKVKLDILMFVAVEGAKNVNYTIEREGHAAGFVALRIKVRRES